MKDETNAKVYRYFTIVILIVIVVGGMYWVWPKFMRGQGLRKQEAELDAKIAETEFQITETAENARRFATDPEFVEFIARENHLTKPGEVVFRFEDDSSSSGDKR